MSRGKKLLFGAGCLWPLIYVLVFLVIPVTRRVLADAGWVLPRHSVTWMSVGAFALQAATMLLTGTMVVFSVLHVSQAKHVSEDERLPWTLLLLLANVLSLPVYWYAYIWRVQERPKPSDYYPHRH